jgi:hypothetical protein
VPGVFAHFVNPNDVGVVQASYCLGLRTKACQIGRRRPHQDHLQGDQPVELYLPRLVNDSHAPVADDLQNIVAGDLRQWRDELAF